jgi:methylmalonyl-CoA mutase
MADDVFLPVMPQTSQNDWLNRVETVLKGADFDKKLVHATADAIRIDPLYGKAEGAKPVIGRPAGQAWRIMARIDHTDPLTANQQALDDLENGANGLHLVFAHAVNSYGFGLPDTVEAVSTALEGVMLDVGADITLDPGPHGKAAIQAVASVVKARNVLPATTKIRFGLDPLGAWAVTGEAPCPPDAFAKELPKRISALVHDLRGRGYESPLLKADGRIMHAAGGSEAQELAFALGCALFYLRGLEAQGLTLEEARDTIEFRLAADADQMLSLAKFRALRLLWARIEKACGLDPKPAFITAETAWRMQTRRDPFVNMLRNTVAVFSAGLGGANAVTVLPFTQALGLPDAFARRMARNTQLVLLEESHLDKVSDPAAGSGGIEHLTQALCEKAWLLLQDSEQKGGIDRALHDGSIGQELRTVIAKRQKDIARRKDPITGTSEFPNINEDSVAVLAPCPDLKNEAPLPVMRTSEAFEALRDASDTMLAKSGQRPRIFLANIGPVAAFTARNQFAKNLFEAGGMETFGDTPNPDLDALMKAFKAASCTMACLCSSDALYAEQGIAVTQALKAAGAHHIYLAGRPADMEQAFHEAGVDGFISAGMDVLAFLQSLHRVAGVS